MYGGKRRRSLCKLDITNKIRLIRKVKGERRGPPEFLRALQRRLSELIILREEYSERAIALRTLSIQRRRNVMEVLRRLDRCLPNIEMDLLRLKISWFVVSNRVPRQYDNLIVYIEDLKSRLKRCDQAQLQKYVDFLNRLIEDLRGNPDTSIYSEAEERLRDVEKRVRGVFAEVDQLIFPERNIVINTREGLD